MIARLSRDDLRVLVLAGGLSLEREVSLRSGHRVLDALRLASVEAALTDVDAELLPRLEEDPPDAVLIALHGASGEDGSLRDVLDLCGVPYVGSTAPTSRRAWDKPLAKAELRDAGIPTPDWVTLPQDRLAELGAAAVLSKVVAHLGLPLMVKPSQGGSGLGVSAVRTVEELPAAMTACFGYDSTALVEDFIAGRDVAVSVLDLGDGPIALPAVEIVPHSGVYDYEARYTAGRTTWHVPARLPAAVQERAAALAVHSHRALGLRHLSRVDMMVTPDGEVQVLEVNVAPGMTETSLMPMAIHAASLEFGQVLRQLATIAASSVARL